MTNGVRIIGGREYLLAGRAGTKAEAEAEAASIRNRGQRVRIIKLNGADWLIYAH